MKAAKWYAVELKKYKKVEKLFEEQLPNLI